MFVGHLAVALAGTKLSLSRAKPRGRPTSFVWFVMAANFVDLIWPIFLLLGLERVRIDPGNTAFTPFAFESYPWTHSLLMGGVWGIGLAAVARWRGVSSTGASIIGALVLSHWVLDFVTHRADLQLFPWPNGKYGLGLWNSIPATLIVEGLLWIAAIAIYLRVRRARGVQ